VKIHLGDVEMKLEPDSGADVNLMDEFHFTNLRKLNEPSGLICIIPNSRSVALLNNGGEFFFPFKTMNFVSIPHVAFCTTVLNSSFEMTEILDEFGSVFEGIGKIKDNKNDSELYVKFNMKPGVAPVAHTSNFILLFVTLRSLGFANEPSGLICIIPNSRSVALLNNGSEFIFPFITMNFVSIPHVAFRTTVLV
jgi:hypothetical protein